MKKYTQKQFDKLPVVDGYKQCPTGDYTAISEFPSYCSFGARCSFEGMGEYQGKYPYLSCVGLGSRIGSCVYFFNLKKGVYVRCGCWFGTDKGFVARVKKEKGDPLYLDLLKVAKKKFKEWNK